MIDLATLSASVQAAAHGGPSPATSSARSLSPELLQRVAFIAMLVKAVAAQQQQLRAQAAARDRTVSLGPPTPVTARTLAVQKVATAIDRARTEQLAAKATGLVEGTIGAAGLAGATALAQQGVTAGLAAVGESLSAAAAAAPVAVPLAVAGILGSIIVPTIASGELFSNKIDPYFDATTAEAMKRAAAQAQLIRQDLAATGTKFARRGATDPTVLLYGG